MSIFIGSNFVPQERVYSPKDPITTFFAELIQGIASIVTTILSVFASQAQKPQKKMKASEYTVKVIPFAEKFAPKPTHSSTIEQKTNKLRIECQELKDDCRKIKTDPNFKLEDYRNPAIRRFLETNDFLPDSTVKLGVEKLSLAQAKGLMLGVKRDYDRNNPTTVDSIRKSQAIFSRTLPEASTGAS